MVKRRDFLLSTGGAAALGVLTAERATRAAAPTSPSAIETGSSTPLSHQNPSSLFARPIGNVLDPTYIDERIDSRSISFENPTGARGGAGKARNGRKGRPVYILEPSEKVVLANLPECNSTGFCLLRPPAINK
jgi:hypothetical protein